VASTDAASGKDSCRSTALGAQLANGAAHPASVEGGETQRAESRRMSVSVPPSSTPCPAACADLLGCRFHRLATALAGRSTGAVGHTSAARREGQPRRPLNPPPPLLVCVCVCGGPAPSVPRAPCLQPASSLAPTNRGSADARRASDRRRGHTCPLHEGGEVEQPTTTHGSRATHSSAWRPKGLQFNVK
jgi:hypothetical protein